MLKQKQMILIMLFVHFECYAYIEREEKFLYKLVGQHKCIYSSHNSLIFHWK